MTDAVGCTTRAKRMETPYNPLDKKNLGTSVADALLTRPVSALPPEKFDGAGVYAIYYTGDFPAYAPIAAANRDGKFVRPIYVGKAIPAGARKGGIGLDADPGTVLHGRLSEHAESIRQAAGLNADHFKCRYLVVDDIWIPLGESLLIQMFSPVWNQIVDGFGNHDPGSGRYKQQRSPWDMIHPGRTWAEKCAPNSRSAEQILRVIAASLKPRT